MPKVKVVSAYIPLQVSHLSQQQYVDYTDRLVTALDGRIVVYEDETVEDLWLHKVRPFVLSMPPATPVPADRYPDARTNLQSHVIQHNRTTWARRAVAEDPTIETVIWLDAAILKQGAWTGKPITEDIVSTFVDKVGKYTNDDIPFPGITPKDQFTLDKHGNNWRFCGSTHIWPVKYLKDIDICYKTQLLRFMYHEKCVPLDLAIWPLVEEHSGLPFRWYQAEYDATQLTEFPDA